MVQQARGTSSQKGAERRASDGSSWEDRHVRATYWLDRGLREEGRKEAEGRGWSVSQFVSWALRRALDKGSLRAGPRAFDNQGPMLTTPHNVTLRGPRSVAFAMASE